jgi:hypothetical protein
VYMPGLISLSPGAKPAGIQSYFPFRPAQPVNPQ